MKKPVNGFELKPRNRELLTFDRLDDLLDMAKDVCFVSFVSIFASGSVCSSCFTAIKRKKTCNAIHTAYDF